MGEDGNPTQILTALKIMKANFKPTRTYYERIEPTNPAFFIFGDSARYKILRAVQLHNCEPPVDASTHEWIPFFQFLSTGVEDHWQVQQQYSSCKWACGKDEELAASQLLHYGWVPKYNVKMGDPCLYRLIKQSWGIAIDTQCPHTFTDRLNAACSAAASAKAKFDSRKMKAKHSDLFKFACQIFFSFQGWYVSMPAAMRQTVLNKLTAYVTHLLNAMGNDAIIPDFEEPDNLFIQEDLIQLKWSDFTFLGISEQQAEQRRDNNDAAAIEALYRNWPAGVPALSSTDLRNYISTRGIKRLTDLGYLTKRREGHKVLYTLNYERSDS